jgi:NitT/TauT family transport system ATP-binding protein
MIRIENLSKSYAARGGDVLAIDDISLTVESGEFVALLGPSGCGKSTLMMCAAGLTPYTSGSISIDDVHVTRPYTECGIAFQNPELLEWRTVLQNVLLQSTIRGLPKDKAQQRARELLASVGLGEFLDRYPRELSGGMQQRVALCRALLHRPSLLLMDEPFGALDALTRDQMNIDLQRIWMQTSMTVLFVTHSIEEAVYLADRVVVLTPRPAQVARDIVIDTPRPRRLADRSSGELARRADEVRQIFDSMGVLDERYDEHDTELADR